LELDVGYTGNLLLMNALGIEAISIFYDGSVIDSVLETAAVVARPGRIVVPIPEQGSQESVFKKLTEEE